eukprot:1218164-Amphidinium_carterae.1
MIGCLVLIATKFGIGCIHVGFTLCVVHSAHCYPGPCQRRQWWHRGISRLPSGGTRSGALSTSRTNMPSGRVVVVRGRD